LYSLIEHDHVSLGNQIESRELIRQERYSSLRVCNDIPRAFDGGRILSGHLSVLDQKNWQKRNGTIKGVNGIRSLWILP
jgi:hypothetical protein